MVSGTALVGTYLVQKEMMAYLENRNAGSACSKQDLDNPGLA